MRDFCHIFETSENRYKKNERIANLIPHCNSDSVVLKPWDGFAWDFTQVNEDIGERS